MVTSTQIDQFWMAHSARARPPSSLWPLVAREAKAGGTSLRRRARLSRAFPADHRVTATYGNPRAVRSWQDHGCAGLAEADETAALVDLDHYRFAYVNPPPFDHNLEYEMSGNDVVVGLKLGFDVVFAGNFRAKEPDPFLENLFGLQLSENYLFYLDASLDQTLRRHETRLDRRITSEKMRELYGFAAATGYREEVIVPEALSVADKVDLITQVAGL